MAGYAYSSPASQQWARKWKSFDWWLLLSAGILLALGVATIFSVSETLDAGRTFKNHVLRVFIGVVPFSVFLFVKPAFWQRWASLLYVFNLLLLLTVLFVGVKGGGAKRWVSFGPIDFQPSEMSKLFLALTVAAFFAARQDSIHKLSTFALSLLHVIVPAALVFKQPHLGATIVLVVIWLSISIVAGVPAKFIVTPILAVVAIFAIGFTVPGILQDYQKERVLSMIKGDEQGSAYQPSRARIAFGVGGLTGVGFRKGEQKKGGHIPDQETDFIFTVVGEEGGFVGAALVVMAFAFFFYRGWLIMYRAIDPFTKMVAAGIIGALAFHTVVNLFMTVQLLPVVGLWLPFFSYGGTAMWLCLASVGLLLGLKLREKPLLF